MSRIFYDKDADISTIKDKTIAVIGYGNQGRSQSLNLRDSDLEVIIGNVKDSYAELADKCGVGKNTIYRRINRLESENIIVKIVRVIPNFTMLNLSAICVMIFVFWPLNFSWGWFISHLPPFLIIRPAVFSSIHQHNSYNRWKIFHLLRYYYKKVENTDFLILPVSQVCAKLRYIESI